MAISEQHVSDAGREAIRQREGEVLHTYRDAMGVLTGGVGHTGRMSPPAPTIGMTITEEMSASWLKADLAPVETVINGLGIPLTQNQFDALASFAFNIGVPGFEHSTCVSCLKHGLTNNAADAMMNWCKPAILKARRDAERRQFLTPDAAPIAQRPIPSSATPVVAEALNPKKENTMTAQAAKPAAKAAAPHVDVLAGIGNIFGNVVSSIESAIAVAASPAVPTVQAGQPVSVGTGVSAGVVFQTISDAESAVTELNQVIADAKAGKWANEPGDIIALLKTGFGVLSRFGINVPVVSAIVSALPTMAPVTAASA